ncbi:EthD family reductase [Galbibacter sp. EGI 63066]|uniref:EthD family reductase n=1 Tax=Galbibacter sp. EGI 63066 TaxID=2993559 RepID=UPI002249544E|nr:EthD family reductase [Galbibacter sp. EGI 63066]MCX2680021.1 EthD family reductase [Galbibacter sp. EGI 63066]
MTTKIKFLLRVFAFMGLISCKNSQLENPYISNGIFKVAILYPSGEGKTFDMDYYEKKHMPMVADFLGENLKFYEIDKGVAGRIPNDKVPFVAIGYFYINDVAEYNEAIGQNIDTIRNDFKNYTNIKPVIQISEIKQVEYNDTK